ncbi:MAG: molybdopterin-guanine dinucleotide biosynthesis protein B [Desulfobacterales bacterium]|nr:MAG: molybdopterin-guanine dinucleotide biosynthesis protein B [Desulfobacterales bacterium]
MPHIISIVGRSQSGKTTLIEKLIPELKKRGYRIGTIKHAHHGFDIDKSGKDSWRHRHAGADTIVVASPGKIAMVKNDDCESLDYLQDYFEDLDLIITEGYKRENKPKIEVLRAARHAELICKADQNLIAVVTDVDINPNVPKFGLEDIKELADLIEETFL